MYKSQFHFGRLYIFLLNTYLYDDFIKGLKLDIIVCQCHSLNGIRTELTFEVYEWDTKFNIGPSSEAVVWRCSTKKVFLKIHRKTSVLEACNFIKKRKREQLFTEHLQTAAYVSKIFYRLFFSNFPY